MPSQLKYAKFATRVRVGQDLHIIIYGDSDILSYTGGIVAFERRLITDIAHSENIKFFLS